MNDNFSDLKDTMNDILSHHGIKNQQWGVRNGPPYPLDKEGKKSFRENWKRKKEAKKRRKIMSDPELLSKNSNMFTEEELVTALNKLKIINEYKREAGLTKNLSKKKKKMANNAASLLANMDKYSPEEYKAAFDRLKKRETIKNMLVESTDRPTRLLGNASKSIESLSNGLWNATKIADNITKYSGGLTMDEQHKYWLKTNKPEGSDRSYAQWLGDAKMNLEGKNARSDVLDQLAANHAYDILERGISSKEDANNLKAYMEFLYGNGKGKGKGNK